MGGCCCCSSRRSQLNATPVYYYCPRTSDEREPLSSHHGASTLSSGLLVHTNLETSTPDTYRAPPAPLPYDMDLGRPQTPPVTQGGSADKIDDAPQTTDTEAIGETISGGDCESLKESGCKIDKNSAVASAKECEVERSKLNEPIVSAVEEEDVCPTCFEDYDEENPRIITKCEHHFHLACILEWMERSDTCPVCDQEMIFNQ